MYAMFYNWFSLVAYPLAACYRDELFALCLEAVVSLQRSLLSQAYTSAASKALSVDWKA